MTTPLDILDTWLCNNLTLEMSGEVNTSTDEWRRLRQADRDKVLSRQLAQQQLIHELMQQARYYKDQAVMSMNLAFEARDKWIAKQDTDLTIDQDPVYKGHVLDNRWYMEWSRVYDDRAQTEMKAYQLGMY